MPNRVEKRFAVDHPTAAGHFPGNPIIPGAVLLAEIVEAIAAGDDRPFATINIVSAKFLRPVRPGDRVAIRWDVEAGGELKFECSLPAEDRPALIGTLRWGLEERWS